MQSNSIDLITNIFAFVLLGLSCDGGGKKWTNVQHTCAKNFRGHIGDPLNQHPHCVNSGTEGQLLQQALPFVRVQLLYNEFHPLKTSYSSRVDLFFQRDVSRIEK